MAWFAFLLLLLFQAPAPSAPAPSASRHAAAAPARPRLEGEIIASATIAGVDHARPQVANRRFSERRLGPFPNAFLRNGSPPAPEAAPRVGESGPQPVRQDGVPDPFDRYARIIFPVPPPLR